MTYVHSCSYYCDRPECIKAQRDELRDRLAQPEQECWCTTCRPITMADMRFVVCPDCGNKRCPKANDHRNVCTNSNEGGQKRSSWEHVKPLAQPERHELQAKGEHPAPCARHCEATAFQIVIKNLEAQLAQPEQEPKLSCGVDYADGLSWLKKDSNYFSQPKRKPWAGLTDEEKAEIWSNNETAMVVTATEAKLKEKNT